MGTLVGSYASIASMLDEAAGVPGTTGVMLCFDDFVAGMEAFGTRIQPRRRSRCVALADSWCGMTSLALPIIDVSSLSTAAPASRLDVGRQFRDACLEHGFFYIVGHGVPSDLVEAAASQARAFFALPEATKNSLHMRHSAAARGATCCSVARCWSRASPPISRRASISARSSLLRPSERTRAGCFNLRRRGRSWPEGLPDFPCDSGD